MTTPTDIINALRTLGVTTETLCDRLWQGFRSGHYNECRQQLAFVDELLKCETEQKKEGIMKCELCGGTMWEDGRDALSGDKRFCVLCAINACQEKLDDFVDKVKEAWTPERPKQLVPDKPGLWWRKEKDINIQGFGSFNVKWHTADVDYADGNVGLAYWSRYYIGRGIEDDGLWGGEVVPPPEPERKGG
jgi:hypothetical protein